MAFFTARRHARIGRELRQGHLELPALIGLALLGGAIGLGVLSVGGFGPSPWQQSAELRFWVFLIVAQTATWALGAAVLLSAQLRMPLAGIWAKARAAVTTGVLAAAVPLVGFASLASLHSSLQYPLPHHAAKIFVLSLIGSAVALLGVAELALVKTALQDEPARGSAADIERFLELRAVLQRILAVEGTILGTAILATGALRNAVIAYPDHLRANPAYVTRTPTNCASCTPHTRTNTCSSTAPT